MKVLLINTSERTGGAAIAAYRLMEALKKQGVGVQMLVRDKQTHSLSVVAVGGSWLWRPLMFLWERLCIYMANRFSRRGLFGVDIANAGTDVTQLREFRQADIIHLHWVNQGFLSMNTLERIMRCGKPVVITMHDMWYFTGICHYASDCTLYQTHCECCPQLGGGRGLVEYARKVFGRKQRIYAQGRPTFVGCSRWIAGLARQSVLTQGLKVVSIPNAIDTTVFHSLDRAACRKELGLPLDKKLLLFGAQRITDRRKGFCHLAEACRLIQQENPDLAAEVEIIVVGGDSTKVQGLLPFRVWPVSYVSDEQQMAGLYNAADVYVTPSLQDNLPNTIVEAMACGIPCVGFRVGGIPEMIDHGKNGYVADYQDAADFARGIMWVLAAGEGASLSDAALAKARVTFSEEVVAKKYMELYEDISRHRNL